MYPKSFRIGRRGPGGIKHAFDIVRRDDGGISLRNLQGITDAEKTMLLAHFGAAHKGKQGKRLDDGTMATVIDTLKPGDEQHFVRAVYKIPAPFALMGRGE